MIKIEIKKVNVIHEKVIKNFCVKEEPTEIVKKSGYDSREEVQFKREYGPMEVTETRTETVNLLNQEVMDESNFDLVEVIKAINKINKESWSKIA